MTLALKLFLTPCLIASRDPGWSPMGRWCERLVDRFSTDFGAGFAHPGFAIRKRVRRTRRDRYAWGSGLGVCILPDLQLERAKVDLAGMRRVGGLGLPGIHNCLEQLHAVPLYPHFLF